MNNADQPRPPFYGKLEHVQFNAEIEFWLCTLCETDRPEAGSAGTYKLDGMRAGYAFDDAIQHLHDEHNDRSAETTAGVLRILEQGGPRRPTGGGVFGS